LSAAIAFACHSNTAKQRFSNLFAEAITKVDKFSLQPVSQRQLFESAMKGMLGSLDENSTYLTGDDYQEMEQRLRQQFGGVGMYVDVNPKTKDLTVTSPIPDSPAFKSGIRSGDIIAKINGFPAQGLDRSEAIERMRGSVGERLVLSIQRHPDETPREIDIVREVIPTPSVVGDVRNADGSWNYFLAEDSRIAYVNIIEFSNEPTWLPSC
jgi:carboxyl-terminal processing protease